ncbi:MAG: pitrilysin family protein [Verrucomicrobia bacterium]|jgi:predicted Zn-dependent peptidase|nr:pitrilysin family protein [Verrucomicrobiota bacterium]
MLIRVLLPALTLAVALSAETLPAIPPRPEALKFPTLNYEPPDPREYRVALKAGPVAYVVPDRELPLVTVSILVRSGAYLDPVGQEGLAAFTGGLLVRGGTTSKTAEALDERLAFLAAQMGASIGDDLGTVSLNLLSKDLPEGLAILREVLTQPRFQADKLELQRQQTLQALQQRNDDSSSIEARELENLSYGNQFWAARQPTSGSVNSLKREDLQAFHRRWFHPSNFIVSVSGDFDRATMVQTLEKLFADWPFQGEVPPPIPSNLKPAGAGVYLVNKDVPQGRVSILLPGVMRDDPDYPAILLMNDILGGGGFTSRIMNRVRSDEGLAYSAGSAFPGGVWYPSTFRAGFQSKSRTVTYATSIVLEEMKRMAAGPVTDEELQTAKRSFIESFSENFNTKSKVAGIFAREEFTGRFAKAPDFWKGFRQRLDRVQREDIQRVAAKHLHPERVSILVVGNKEEILKGHPDHPISLEKLVPAPLTELPLRDPLTLEPIKAGSESGTAK